ncbi:MAG: alpha/beta fold hydrolase, partial [Tagaea sp.]
ARARFPRVDRLAPTAIPASRPGFARAARAAAAILAILCLAAGIWQLEAARAGLSIAPLAVGTTPATVYRQAGQAAAPAPLVAIAHGFAGSRQLMEPFAMTLARAGYVVVSFDFEGHGRNPVPMSGDVAHVDGTTRVLMREVARVVEAGLALPGVVPRAALLGHSMASDILVRAALADPRIEATVAVSMFSEAVTPAAPRNLLIVSGEWEGRLRAAALNALHLADPAADENETAGDPARGTGRRAAVAPAVEHVGVLFSATALGEARAWLDASFGREASGPVAATGGAVALLLFGAVLLAWPLANLLPRGAAPPAVPLRVFCAAVSGPALATPFALTFVDTRFLPVLVADYLAVHLFVYGLASLAILRRAGVRFGPIAWGPALALAAYGILVFGGLLDRYVASFWPIPERLGIFAAIAAGAVPFMLADALAVEGGRAALWRVLVARGAFLGSLAIAVAFDFERLFFLAIVVPVIVLFFAIFGAMGGWVGRRTGSPAAAGVGMGVLLAWAIGVAFPMFAGGG